MAGEAGCALDSLRRLKDTSSQRGLSIGSPRKALQVRDRGLRMISASVINMTAGTFLQRIRGLLDELCLELSERAEGAGTCEHLARPEHVHTLAEATQVSSLDLYPDTMTRVILGGELL